MFPLVLKVLKKFPLAFFFGLIPKWVPLLKNVFLKISQNSQKNTCARVSFLIKLLASGNYYFLLGSYQLSNKFVGDDVKANDS